MTNLSSYEQKRVFGRAFFGTAPLPFATNRKSQKTGDLQNSIVTHPNPAKNFVVFDYSLAATNAEISLTDVAGKVIHTIDLLNTKGETIWDTREIAAGMYFYSVNANGKNIIIGKIVIEK